MLLKSKAIVYGDDVNTDLIIAGKYTKTLNFADLVEHCMEDLDPDFHEKCKDGAIVVAGEYFGCGSSREQAPIALRESGVKCVVAKSYSRIFYRSAINIGLPIVECDTSFISEGDELEYELGDSLLKNVTTGVSKEIRPLPDIMVQILNCGGMVGFMKEHGGVDSFAEKKEVT